MFFKVLYDFSLFANSKDHELLQSEQIAIFSETELKPLYSNSFTYNTMIYGKQLPLFTMY